MTTSPESGVPASDSVESTTAADKPWPSHCKNCGAPMSGPHCHTCGQPVKGLVRHFSSILGDFFDSVFDLDSRLLRTLWPLMSRPGFLSREYFDGHRVRFVSPVRLFVFLIVLAFFLAQISTDLSGTNVINDDDGFAAAQTIEDVEKLRVEALAEIQKSIEDADDVPGLAATLERAKRGINASANGRIRELGGEPPSKKPRLSFGTAEWDKETNPIAISWLPESTNAWLNDRVERMQSNIVRIQEDPNLFKDAVFGLLPQVLFVMLPIFALLLKILYLFKRRLYMEHLIVALHSHAFLALSITLLLVASHARDWLVDGFFYSLFGWIEFLLWLWMPIYLLLMQKRVYQQGWIMTLLKYSVIGLIYVVLLAIALAIASLLTLATI